MDETIELLLKLQEIDSLADELERKRALVPKRRAEQQAVLDAAVAAVAEHKDRVKKKELDKRAAENEVKEIEQTTLRYQTQLNAAKSNDEYRALVAQIRRAKERQNALEDRVLAAMEEIDQVERALGEAEAARKAAHQQSADRDRELTALSASLGEGIQAKAMERKRVASSLDPVTLRRYERIRSGQGAPAVAVIDGYICGGCHGTLPAQTVNEIRRRDKLYTCQFCGRIVVTLSPQD
ncbi:hypothetical protein JXA88_12120 [Candidatus Fermentibacteria bacterium]|nr:hypothetical protein [Candidatus Fermentibacteria bacterium]